MLKEWFILLVLTVNKSSALPQHHPFSSEYIAWINANQSHWKAGRNFHESEWSRLKLMASGVQPENALFVKPPEMHYYVKVNKTIIPKHFDAREAWPYCSSIRQIWDQSQCGSCWAVSAAAAMSDRICIHSHQILQLYVSAEDLLSCCNQCGQQCKGGKPLQAWKYWQKYGVVTGGAFNSSQGCKDYSLPPCKHHNNAPVPSKHNCEQLILHSPQCIKKCDNFFLSYENSRTFGGEVRRFANEESVQLEIMRNGPVQAVMEVYEDFYNYKSGVYMKIRGQYVGKHAVKLLGWGRENGIPYWLCANSWNSDWGHCGYFKLLRSGNHCGILNQVFASLPMIGFT
ncbi:cathepsin B-like [Euwallacea similis]|uniref:cathepsin B-like n=1 Tax=Euwallacea similis TaxID=1736056 RepID=UPI00344C84F6